MRMIETELQEVKKTLDTIIPSHWCVREIKEPIINPKNTKIIAIGSGDDAFRQMLLEGIKSAQETIMLCSFILSDEGIIDAIIRAADRKVRCYLLFASETQLRKEYQQYRTDFDEEVLTAHKLMLDKFAQKVLARTSDHLHAKFLLIDVNTGNSKGFISTANFTYEALTRNQELGVILNPNEIQEAFDFFRRGFWEESDKELTRIRHWDDVKQEKIQHQIHSFVLTTSHKENSLKLALYGIIADSPGALIIGSYSFEEDYELLQLIKQKAKTQKIILLTRPREKNLPTIESLTTMGVEVFAYDYLHAKFVYALEEKKALIMTANFERRGLDTGFEIGLILEDDMSIELDKILTEWIKKAPLKWKQGGVITQFDNGKIKEPSGRSLNEKEICAQHIIPLEPLRPRDLIQMAELMKKQPDLPKNLPNIYPKKITIKREIIPPRLPSDAVEVNAQTFWTSRLSKEEQTKRKIPKKFPTPVYRQKNRYYGSVKTWKELNKVSSHPDLPSNLIYVLPRKSK